MICVHLTASRFFGGPERQILGLARHLRGAVETVFLSFAEEGLCSALLNEASQAGFEAIALTHDTPHAFAACRELVGILQSKRATVLCCHEFKSNTLGLLAARRAGIPVIAVSRGWTGENFRIRCYEALDRRVLRWMDAVVCVSQSQAEKIRRSGVRPDKVTVIQNAIHTNRFAEPQLEYRERLLRLFPSPPEWIVGAAGRLSPEKGFAVLVDAAAEVIQRFPRTGFVIFGDGALRDALDAQIRGRQLQNSFVLAGFCANLDRYLPHFDMVVLPSFTEGLPNVALEAMAAGRPVVGTAVGGIPEVVDDGCTGFLVPPTNPLALAERIVALLNAPERRQAMGAAGRLRVERHFEFAAHANRYRELFERLASTTDAVNHRTRPRVGGMPTEVHSVDRNLYTNLRASATRIDAPHAPTSMTGSRSVFREGLPPEAAGPRCRQIESATRDSTIGEPTAAAPSLNVLLFIDDLKTSLAGTEQHLLFLLTQLPRPRLRLHFAVFSGFDAGNQSRFPMTPEVLSHEARRGLLGSIQKLRRLATLIAQEQIDVVHAFCPMSELLAMVATSLAGRGRVLGVRRNTGYWHNRWTLWRTRLAARFRTELVANCEAVRQYSIQTEWACADRISVIRNPLLSQRRQAGFDRAVTRSSLGLDEGGAVVGIVANIRPVKDYATFLRAARLIMKRHPKVHFLVVGAGDPNYVARMHTLADELSLGHRVSWLGAVENPFSVLPLFDVGVLSSRSEGFSTTLLEYAAAGIPAVATDVGGTREIVVDGQTGFVVPPAAPEAMAERIGQVLESHELRCSLGQRARTRAEAAYNDHEIIRQYHDLYARIVHGPPRNSRVRALTLTLHGILAGNAAATSSLDVDEARYAIDLQRFQMLLEKVEPKACCTASDLLEKTDGNWTILTFDDGLVSDYRLAFPALQERKLRATFFVTVNNVGQPGYTDQDQLREMAEAGMEIASHGLTHRYLVAMSRREAIAEMSNSKAQLEDLLGRKVTAFAPVGGHSARWMVGAAAEAGYRVFATMVPGQSRCGKGMVLLRRNHLQAHHDAAYVARLLDRDPKIFCANRLRYELLRLPKRALGMETYDRLKQRVLRHPKILDCPTPVLDE